MRPRILRLLSAAVVGVIGSRAGTDPATATPETRLAAACVAESLRQSAALPAEAAAMTARLAEYPPAAEPLVVDCLSLMAAGQGAVPVGAGGFSGRALVYRAPAPPGAEFPGVEALGSAYVSPLLLNLEGDPIPDVPGGELDPHPFGFSPGRTAWFDIDGDGYPDLTEWPGPGLGFLVHAPGGLPPPVLSGADLIGDAGGFQDGFEHLAAFDLDGDGKVAGAELADLLVWRDANSDARQDPSEWLTPAALRLEALYLAHTGAEGSCLAGGRLGRLWDWWPTFCTARPVAPGPKAAAAQPALTGLPGPVADPDATAFLPFPSAATWVLMPYGWLEAIGFNSALSQLAAVAPRGDGVVLLDRPLVPPRRPRLWVLTRDARAGGWRAARFDLQEDTLESAAYSGTGTQLLVSSRGGGHLYVVQKGQVWGPIQWTSPPGVAFRTAFAPPFAAGNNLYLAGYFHDANGVPLADSLAVLKLSRTKASLKAVAEVRWLTGDGLPQRGYELPRMVQVTGPKTAVAVVRDAARAEDVLLAITGSTASAGAVRELDRAPAITALSACPARVFYLVQQAGGVWQVRSVSTRGKAVVPAVWARTDRPASLECASKGLTAYWQEIDWAGARTVLAAADASSPGEPAAAPLPGPPGALRAAALEPFFVLQRPIGLQMGLW